MTPELPFDPATGEMVEPTGDTVDGCSSCAQLQAMIDVLTGDLKAADLALRTERRKTAALKAELDQQRKNAPEAQIIETIFRYWIEKTGRNPKRTKLGEKREKAVLARLREGYTPEDLLRAIDGLVLAANSSSTDVQRQALLLALRDACDRLPPDDAQAVRASYGSAMKGVQVFDDLELVMRNEVNVERFRSIAERIDPRPMKSPLDV